VNGLLGLNESRLAPGKTSYCTAPYDGDCYFVLGYYTFVADVACVWMLTMDQENIDGRGFAMRPGADVGFSCNQAILNLVVNAIEAMSGANEAPRELLLAPREPSVFSWQRRVLGPRNPWNAAGLW
jgi:hypothetical protein